MQQAFWQGNIVKSEKPVPIWQQESRMTRKRNKPYPFRVTMPRLGSLAFKGSRTVSSTGSGRTQTRACSDSSVHSEQALDLSAGSTPARPLAKALHVREDYCRNIHDKVTETRRPLLLGRCLAA